MRDTRDAIARILSSLPEPERPTVWDYETDFEDLWKLNRPDSSHAIVVWTRTPQDAEVRPVVTEPLVTPFDWAIVACSRYTGLRVTVVDIRPAQALSEPPVALRWLQKQRPESVPWLRRIGLKELIAIDEAQELREKLITPWAVAGSLVSEPADAIDLLWRSVRTSTADHHGIANLIGPLLLLPAAPRTGHRLALSQVLQESGRLAGRSSAVEPAQDLFAELKRLGPVRVVLLDDQWQHGWGEWVAQRLGLTWDSASASALAGAARPEPTRACGDATGTSLWVSRSPAWIAARIDSALAETGEPDARFRFRLTEDAEGFSEILLLDLRLFSSEVEEKRFVETLVSGARRYEGGGAWSAIGKKEIDALEIWAKGRGATEADRTSALTLLPRFLAHVDLSMPVVLFSSTGRRGVVEKLKGYDSVITRFAKPRLLGDSLSEAQEATAAFDGAMREAVRLLRGRVCVTRALGKRRSMPPVIEASSDVGTAPRGPFKHAALYLDESAPPTNEFLAVGGILALYPEAEKETALDDDLKRQGIHWGPGGKPKYRKADDHAPDWCDRVVAIAQTHGVALSAVALTVEERDREQAVGHRLGRGWRRDPLDRLHRTLIRATIEASLYHVVDSSVMAEGWTFGVVADVRSRPASDLGKEIGEAGLRELREKFGVFPDEFSPPARRLVALRDLFDHSFEEQDIVLRGAIRSGLALSLRRAFPRAAGIRQAVQDLVGGSAPGMGGAGEAPDARRRLKDAFYESLKDFQSISYIGTDGVLPIVEDLLHQYEGATSRPAFQLVEARGCTLPEESENALKRGNWSLHYFADWVAGAVRASRQSNPEPLPAWLSRLLSGGCNDTYDDALRRRLRFARWALRGDVARAAGGFFSDDASAAVSSSLRDRCAKVVAEGVLASKGPVFVDACQRAAVWATTDGSGPRGSLSRNTGTRPSGGGGLARKEVTAITSSRPVTEQSPAARAAREQASAMPGSVRMGPIVECKQLWVGQWSRDVTESELVDLFGAYGTVTKVQMWPKPQRRHSYAFVSMRTSEQAAAAMNGLGGTRERGFIVNWGRDRTR